MHRLDGILVEREHDDEMVGDSRQVARLLIHLVSADCGDVHADWNCKLAGNRFDELASLERCAAGVQGVGDYHAIGEPRGYGLAYLVQRNTFDKNVHAVTR